MDFLCELYYDARIHEHQSKVNIKSEVNEIVRGSLGQ